MNQEKSTDRATRTLELANRIDWALAFACLAWAAYTSSVIWAAAGISFLLVAWINPVARVRKAMARKLVKRS